MKKSGLYLNLGILTLGLVILVITSCGQPVCVAGFGDCSAPERPTTTTTSSSSSSTTTTTTTTMAR